MLLRNQLTLIFFLTGCLSIGTVLTERTIDSYRTIEGGIEDRAVAITEAVSSLISDDLATGSLQTAAREVELISKLPGINHISVLGINGKDLLDQYRKGLATEPAGNPSKDEYVVQHQSEIASNVSGKIMGKVQVGIDTPDLDNVLSRSLWRGLKIAILSLVIIVIVAHALGRFLARRLEKVVEALEHAEETEPLRVPETGSHSEMDRLARSFNGLHARLHSEKLKRKKLEALKIDMTNMLVHDMKQPITIIKTALACLKDSEGIGLTNEKNSNLMHMVDRALIRQDAMIEDLLQIAKLNNAKMPIRMRPILLRDFLKECEEVNALLVERFLRRWSLEASEEILSRKLYGDNILLKRLIGNLILNAVEHCPEGTLITLGARAWLEDSSQVEIFVRDRGPGISAGIRENIFNKFTTFAESAKNIGLGLAYCKLVAERHAGHLELSSIETDGATFSLVLPLFSETTENRSGRQMTSVAAG